MSASSPFPTGADRIVVARCTFLLADGETIEREWTLKEIGTSSGHLPLAGGPPKWLEGSSRTWDNPQDPIIFTGRVRAGYEDAARRYLGVE